MADIHVQDRPEVPRDGRVSLLSGKHTVAVVVVVLRKCTSAKRKLSS